MFQLSVLKLKLFSMFRILNPSEKILYTWADPAGDRIILWDDGDKHVENDLRRDGAAQFQ